MTKFELIKTIEDIRFDLQNSTAFSNERITETCNLGKDIWIKYYHCGTLDNCMIKIDGSEGLGGIPTIMIYVENENKTYNVYRYNGSLIINRSTIEKIRHENLTNLNEIVDDIINELE